MKRVFMAIGKSSSRDCSFVNGSRENMILEKTKRNNQRCRFPIYDTSCMFTSVGCPFRCENLLTIRISVPFFCFIYPCLRHVESMYIYSIIYR